MDVNDGLMNWVSGLDSLRLVDDLLDTAVDTQEFVATFRLTRPIETWTSVRRRQGLPTAHWCPSRHPLPQGEDKEMPGIIVLVLARTEHSFFYTVAGPTMEGTLWVVNTTTGLDIE